jgi:anti-sigma factor RsiW
MNPNDLMHGQRTWQQLLASYADGETTDEERQIVESWLQQYPGMAEELAGQQSLSPTNQALWQEAAVPLPADERWQATLGGIAAATLSGVAMKKNGGKRGRGWRRLVRPWFLAVVGLASAAAVLLAVFAPWRAPAPVVVTTPHGNDENTETVFSVATTKDVDIISVRPADLPHVVVGEPPIPETLTFASAADVKVHGTLPDWDGMKPNVHSGDNSGMPMIFAPLAREP